MWHDGPIYSAKTRRNSGVASVILSQSFRRRTVVYSLILLASPSFAAQSCAPFSLSNFPLSLPYLVLGRLI